MDSHSDYCGEEDTAPRSTEDSHPQPVLSDVQAPPEEDPAPGARGHSATAGEGMQACPCSHDIAIIHPLKYTSPYM